jgi:hypothetical protein
MVRSGTKISGKGLEPFYRFPVVVTPGKRGDVHGIFRYALRGCGVRGIIAVGVI